MADQAVDKVIESEAKALKSAEAAFEAASAEIAKPAKAAVEAPAKTVEAVAKAAPAPAKKAPAKPAARRVAKAAPKAKVLKRKITNKKAPARKPAALSKTQGVKTMTSKTKTAEIFGADRFQAAFGEINERAKAASEKGAKIAEELTDLTRGNVEALVASSKVAQKGFETLSQGAADFGRKSFEEASATLKSLTEVKSATDLFKLQGDYARSAFDAAVAESARLSEAMLKIASDVAEPINSRYTVAAERVKTLAAA